MIFSGLKALKILKKPKEMMRIKIEGTDFDGRQVTAIANLELSSYEKNGIRKLLRTIPPEFHGIRFIQLKGGSLNG